MNPSSSESDKARAFILKLLSRGLWYAPHEIHREIVMRCCDLSSESSGARRRDLKKPQYGHHNVVKRKRAGTDYWEYTILANQQDKEAA